MGCINEALSPTQGAGRCLRPCLSMNFPLVRVEQEGGHPGRRAAGRGVGCRYGTTPLHSRSLGPVVLSFSPSTIIEGSCVPVESLEGIVGPPSPLRRYLAETFPPASCWRRKMVFLTGVFPLLNKDAGLLEASPPRPQPAVPTSNLTAFLPPTTPPPPLPFWQLRAKEKGSEEALSLRGSEEGALHPRQSSRRSPSPPRQLGVSPKLPVQDALQSSTSVDHR